MGKPDPIVAKAKALFEKSQLTLEELGLAMRYEKEAARTSAWQFLNRTNDPKISVLRRFAEALNISVEALFSEVQPQQETVMVSAIIHGNGTWYTDGVERLYLHFRKTDPHGLPTEDGVKTRITITAAGHQYRGILNARADYPYLFVSPKLTDERGKSHKFAHLCAAWGLAKAGRVNASVLGSDVKLDV